MACRSKPAPAPNLPCRSQAPGFDGAAAPHSGLGLMNTAVAMQQHLLGAVQALLPSVQKVRMCASPCVER